MLLLLNSIDFGISYFDFHLSSGNLWFLLWFLWHHNSLAARCSVFTHLWFSHFSSCNLFLGSNHCDQKRSLFWFQFLNCIETCSVSHHMVYPWESFTCTWEECVFCCSQLFYILLFCFSCLRCIYSNSYCLLDEFFPYYILSILSFVAFYFFFLPWCLFCLIWIWVYSLSFGWICLHCYLLFLHHSSTFVFRTEMSVQEEVYCWLFRFFLSIHSVILFLSIGEFNSFAFRIIFERWGFSTAIFYFVFWLL